MRMRWRLVPPALALVVATARAQTGGGYDLSWNTLQPGGGIASSGGGFDVSGALGPAAAAHVLGGGFDLQGGFWQRLPGATGVGDQPAFVPKEFALLAGTPNPFQRTIALAFDLPTPRHVVLEVFDVSGHRVRGLVDATLAPGRHHLTWDGLSDAGARAGAGIYFLHLTAGADRASSRIALIH
jgi:hypothetical protein